MQAVLYALRSSRCITCSWWSWSGGRQTQLETAREADVCQDITSPDAEQTMSVDWLIDVFVEVIVSQLQLLSAGVYTSRHRDLQLYQVQRTNEVNSSLDV